MVCREVIAFLDEYVAGELVSERRAEFDRHLAVCASCVAYLSTYRETILFAKVSVSPEIEDVPAEVITAILATITRR